MSEPAEMKSCPFCAETILAKAIKCKHCGSSLGDQPLQTTTMPLAGVNLPMPPVSSPTATTGGSNGNSLQTELIRMIENGRKIEAIKRCREGMNLGLKEAKDYVETLSQREGATTTSVTPGRRTDAAHGSPSDRPKKIEVSYTWPCIILAFLVFWPLAIPMLIGRAKRDRRTTFAIGKVLGWGGFICGTPLLLLLLFFPGMYCGPKDELWIGMCIMSGLFVVLGLPALIVSTIGIRLVFWSERIKSYLDLIVNKHVFSIPAIAGKMNLPEAKVLRDLKEMVKQGFLPDAQIDETRKIVIVPAVEAQMRFQEEVAQAQRPAASMAPAAIPGSGTPPTMLPPRPEVARPQMRACRCCGANNLVWPNREPLCEFCGSIV